MNAMEIDNEEVELEISPNLLTDAEAFVREVMGNMEGGLCLHIEGNELICVRDTPDQLEENGHEGEAINLTYPQKQEALRLLQAFKEFCVASYGGADFGDHAGVGDDLLWCCYDNDSLQLCPNN
jgi:hypothetical protein